MNNPHWYLHVDLDAFFASVEQLDHPEYRGKPVIVGGLPSDKRSVVSTASYEARKYGVHSAMPTWQALKLCPNGIYVRGNHQRYAELSYKIMMIFKDFSPDVDQMSIDEAFIDLTGTEQLFGPPEETAMKIKQKVKDYTGLTVSVGLAQTKYLAKIASAMSKPDGFYFIKPGTEQEFMLNLPLEKVWGLGKKSIENLNKKGFFTTKDIFNKDYDYLEFLFGTNTATFLYNVVRGLDNNSFSRKNAKNHSISAETTFITDITDIYTIETAILELAHGVFFRLLKEKSYSKTAFIKIRYDDFSTVSIQHTYEKNICTLDSFYNYLQQLFEEKYIPNRGVRLIGVGFDNIVKEKKPEQQELFDTYDNKKEKVEQTILSMEQKNPKLKVQKARLLNNTFQKGNKLKQILIIFLLSFSLQKMNPQALFDIKISDKSNFQIKTEGSYEASVEENLSFNFFPNSPFSFLPGIPVFKQNIDLSLEANLLNKFIFNFSFKDEFANNTFSFLYNGDNYFQNLFLSNRKVIFPDYYSSKKMGYGLNGGTNQAPGLSLHFADYKKNKWLADFIIRYDMLTQESATFYGSNKVTDFEIPIKNYLYGYSFYIPDSNALSQIKNIYVENENGKYFDKQGRKYQKLNESQYSIFLEYNQIVFSNDSLTSQKDSYIPRIIITFQNDSTIQNLISTIGTYKDEKSFLGQIQTYFNSSNKIYNLSDFSYTLDTTIENQNGLVIQNNYGFSPFLICNTYNLGLIKNVDLSIISKSSELKSNQFNITELSNESLSTQLDYFEEATLLAQITNNNLPNNSLSNPETRYPFGSLSPEIYIELPSDLDLEILARSYSPVNNYFIGTNVSEGSVQVFVNNILDSNATFDSQSGIVSLGKNVSNTDKVFITWAKDTSDFSKGNVSAGIGFLYNYFDFSTKDFQNKLTSDISITTQLPLLFTDTYSSYQNIHSAFLAVTLGTDFYYKNFYISDKTSLSFLSKDITGLFLANSQNNNLQQTNYLSASDGFSTQTVPNINLPLENSYRAKTEQIIPVTDLSISGYKIPLYWNFNQFSNLTFENPSEKKYFWQAIDIKLSNFEDLTNCCELEFAIQPNIFQNSTNTKDLSVYLQLGIKAGTSTIYDWEELPCWEITNLAEQNVITTLDLNKNDWQVIKIKLSDLDRIKLTSSHDARLIVVSNNNFESSGTIYFGPYEQINQNIFVYSNENIKTSTETVLDTTSNSATLAKIQNNYSTKINWKVEETASDLSLNKKSNITAISYFESSDFSSYNTINFDFAYTYSEAENLTEMEDSTSTALELILDEGSESALENGKIALKVSLYDTSSLLTKEAIYHTLSVNTKTKEVFIDNTKLPSTFYNLELNNSILPNRQKIVINTISKNTKILKGSFYINNLYFKDSTPNLLLQNNFETSYKNDNSSITLNSTQSAVLNPTNSDVIVNNDNYIEAETTLAGINFSTDLSLSFSTDLQNNKGLTSAGHSIKTTEKLFKFLNFSEIYRFNNEEKSLQKENSLEFDFSNYFVPINILAKTTSKDYSFSQQQNSTINLNFSIPISKVELDFNIFADFLQKIKNSQQQNDSSNLNYFSSWLDITKLAFSTGNEKAENRNENYAATFITKTAFFDFSPELNITFLQNYSNIITSKYGTKTKIHLLLPITIDNHRFTFYWEKSLFSENSAHSNGNYFIDSQKLFKTQGDFGWFYGVFPIFDLFDKKINDNFKNTTQYIGLLFNSTYKINWKRKLFNNNVDFFVPSSITFECAKDTSKVQNLNEIYQFKLQTENTAITKNIDFLFSTNSVYKIPNFSLENSQLKINLFTSTSLYLKDSHKINFIIDTTYETQNNFFINNRITWERPGKSSLVSVLYYIFTRKDNSFITTRKDSISVGLAFSNNEFSQKYEYVHNCNVKILKYASINTGFGTGISIKETFVNLDLLIQLGLKIEF